jgi:hypothetical protein
LRNESPRKTYRTHSRLAFAGAAFALVGTALLASCASQVMKNYVGGPLEVVMLDYGPPDNVIEIGAGERAYQWRRVNTEAVTGTTSGEVRQTRHGERYEVSESPGYVKETECFYTFYARAAGTRWIVTNFRKPKLECE